LNPPNTKTLGDWLDDLKFESQLRKDIYIYISLLQNVLTASGTHPPFFNGSRVSFPKLQPTGCDVHSPASSADVKNKWSKWSYTSATHIWHRQG
jgi:hypothetical protein